MLQKPTDMETVVLQDNRRIWKQWCYRVTDGNCNSGVKEKPTDMETVVLQSNRRIWKQWCYRVTDGYGHSGVTE
jgi:hypothetical protein